MKHYENIVHSLIKNFDSIQSKVDALLEQNEKLDVKQITDIERYIGMQSVIINSLSDVERIFLGEK